MSIRRFSNDGLSEYIVASHGFIIGLRRLKPTLLKITRGFLSKNIIRYASTRIGGSLDAIKCEKRPLTNRISFKSLVGGPKISSGLPGSSRANGWPEGLRVVQTNGNVITYRNIIRSNLAIELRCPENLAYKA